MNKEIYMTRREYDSLTRWKRFKLHLMCALAGYLIVEKN